MSVHRMQTKPHVHTKSTERVCKSLSRLHKLSAEKKSVQLRPAQLWDQLHRSSTSTRIPSDVFSLINTSHADARTIQEHRDEVNPLREHCTVHAAVRVQLRGEPPEEGLDEHQHLQPALHQDCRQRCPEDHCQPSRNVRDLLHLDHHSSRDMLEQVDADPVDEERDAKEAN